MSSNSLAVDIKKASLYDEAPAPANGDPYVAVVMATNENGVATQTETLTLGTGFKSLDQLAHEVRQRVNHPELTGHTGIGFSPDRAEVFSIAGTVTFS